jgi:hypothetical protein
MRQMQHTSDGSRHDRSRASLRRAIAAALLLAAAPSLAQNVPYQSSNRYEVGTGFGREEVPMGSYVEPRLEGAIQYADNVGLAENGGESAGGAEVTPGIYASYGSTRFTGAIDYSLIARFWEDGELDDVTHQLAANSRWTAVPGWFFVDADATYGDTVIDYGLGGNYGNVGVFNTGNMTEAASFSVRPTLQRRFSDLELLLAYSYGQSLFFDEGKGEEPLPVFGLYGTDDSEDQSATFSFGLVPDGRKLSGRVFYEWQHSEFDRSIPYEYERAGATAAWELTRTVALVADGGRESDLDESTTEGGLDSDFWSAGLRWAKDIRTSAEVRYGERFFGESWLVSLRHAARMLEFSASYDESPEVQTRQMSLDRFDPGTLPPGYDPAIDFGRFNSSPYVGKNSNAGIAAKGSRTTLRLEGFYTERDYIDDRIGTERSSGARFDASRDLASNFSIDAGVSYTDYYRRGTTLDPIPPDDAGHDYDTEVVLRANKEFSPKLSASLESGWFNRSGTTVYDGWWVALRGRWTPGSRR